MRIIANNKGITLVSLVVTIIILIILAGVSINMTLGEEGLITIAKKAKENIEFAQIEEQEKLNELYSQLEGNEGITGGEIDYDAIAKLNNFKKAIADYIEEAGGIKPDYTDSTETFGERIKGIVKEVTKDATATEEDITEGKTAWVNGERITGTANNGKLELLDIKLMDYSSNIWNGPGNEYSSSEFKINTEKFSQINISNIINGSSVHSITCVVIDDKGNTHSLNTSSNILDISQFNYIIIKSTLKLISKPASAGHTYTVTIGKIELS